MQKVNGQYNIKIWSSDIFFLTQKGWNYYLLNTTVP